MAARTGVRAQVLTALNELGFPIEDIMDSMPFEDLRNRYGRMFDEVDYEDLVHLLQEQFVSEALCFPIDPEPDIAHTLDATVHYICEYTDLAE